MINYMRDPEMELTRTIELSSEDLALFVFPPTEQKIKVDDDDFPTLSPAEREYSLMLLADAFFESNVIRKFVGRKCLNT